MASRRHRSCAGYSGTETPEYLDSPHLTVSPRRLRLKLLPCNIPTQPAWWCNEVGSLMRLRSSVSYLFAPTVSRPLPVARVSRASRTAVIALTAGLCWRMGVCDSKFEKHPYPTLRRWLLATAAAPPRRSGARHSAPGLRRRAPNLGGCWDRIAYGCLVRHCVCGGVCGTFHVQRLGPKQ